MRYRAFLRKVLNHCNNIGLVNSIIFVPEYLCKRISTHYFRKFNTPTLAELNRISLSAHHSVHTMPIFPDNENGELSWYDIEAEYKLLIEELGKRQKSTSTILAYPSEFAIESNTRLLLYALTRIVKPRIFLECGVADGHSTFFILNALLQNGHGHLYSVDVNANVGSLLSESEKKLWSLKILNRKKPRQDFKIFVDSLLSIDLFLHDSDHSYGWQLFEYSCVAPKLGSTGIFISDDIDASYAFIDFCVNNRLTPILLFDERKIVGVVKM